MSVPATVPTDDPAGPHPVAQERHREVLVEFDARDCLAPNPDLIP